MCDTITSDTPLSPDMYIGREISGITLVEPLGKGATGLVYTAYQKSLKRKVAIKLFLRKRLSNKFVEKFRTEAETVAVLNHPNIVPVYDMGETEEFLFIVMQLIVGKDLQATIQRLRRHPVPSLRIMPKKDAIKIMIVMLDALGYAHSQQVIHQDVKPANIIIEELHKRPYLVDFGIARTFFSEQGVSKVVSGTPLYMAPEQAAGQQTDARADIYSAGMVLYETVSGTVPVKALQSEQMVKAKIFDSDSIFLCKPSQHCPAIDGDLEKIICKAIASEPSIRYQDCASFKEDLLSYVSGLNG